MMNNMDEESVEFAQGGILGGGALDRQESIKALPMDGAGYHLLVRCYLCGKSHKVDIGWDELFLLGANGPGQDMLLPQGWEYSENNQDAYPALRCCHQDGVPTVCPHFSPEESRKLINVANQKGFINPAAAAQWKAHIAARRRQG